MLAQVDSKQSFVHHRGVKLLCSSGEKSCDFGFLKLELQYIVTLVINCCLCFYFIGSSGDAEPFLDVKI